MAYLNDTNNKILVFLNRAQTKIGIVSVLVADKVSEDSRFETYRDEVEIAYGLLSFVRSLDNLFNDWTESEIIKYIDKWNAKANLNLVPYFEHSEFNLRITFGSTSSSTCDIASKPIATLPLVGDEYVEILQDGVCKRVLLTDLPGGGTTTSNVIYDDLTDVLYDDLTNVIYGT